MEYLQYYKGLGYLKGIDEVLNLVISGIPSILKMTKIEKLERKVLNLVISGIPSIQGR